MDCFLFAGAGGLRQAGKPERAGNPPGTYIVLPATGSGAGHARRGGGRTRESGKRRGEEGGKGRGELKNIGNHLEKIKEIEKILQIERKTSVTTSVQKP